MAKTRASGPRVAVCISLAVLPAVVAAWLAMLRSGESGRSDHDVPSPLGGVSYVVALAAHRARG